MNLAKATTLRANKGSKELRMIDKFKYFYPEKPVVLRGDCAGHLQVKTSFERVHEYENSVKPDHPHSRAENEDSK